MKQTPLIDKHKNLKAKLTNFAGYEMPLYYEGIIKEHIWVREKCGIFDISHMAEIFVKGNDSVDFLDYVLTNRVKGKKPGKVFYSAICNESGGTVDDVVVYVLTDNKFLVVANASNRNKVFNWFLAYSKQFDVEIEDKSDEYSMIAVQGPLSCGLLKNIFGDKLGNIKYYTHNTVNLFGKTIIASRTGYTGEDGFEFIVRNEHASDLWEKISALPNVKPIGLGARDTLRLECCYCLYGNELSDDITPMEAGIDWVVKLEKGFIGKENMIKRDKKRIIAAFEMKEKKFARKGFKIFSNERNIGYVTSAGFLPFVKKNAGLCLIDSENANIGNEIFIEIRGEKERAVIVDKPFYIPIQKRRSKDVS